MATPTVTSPLVGTIPSRTPLVDASGMITFPWNNWFRQFLQSRFPSIPAFFSDTHARRASVLASDYASGSIYYETDRQVWYVAIGGVWTFMAGMFSANLSQLPDDLKTSDVGFEMFVNDYAHRLTWNGTGWQWGAGDSGSGYTVDFVGAVPEFGWHVCDGSRALTLQPGGNLVFVTTPVAPGRYLRK